MVDSSRGRARAKLVFLALGLPSKGRVQVNSEDLVGPQAMVEIEPVDYPGPGGAIIRRNEVPYDDWRRAP